MSVRGWLEGVVVVVEEKVPMSKVSSGSRLSRRCPISDARRCSTFFEVERKVVPPVTRLIRPQAYEQDGESLAPAPSCSCLIASLTLCISSFTVFSRSNI